MARRRLRTLTNVIERGEVAALERGDLALDLYENGALSAREIGEAIGGKSAQAVHKMINRARIRSDGR